MLAGATGGYHISASLLSPHRQAAKRGRCPIRSHCDYIAPRGLARDNWLVRDRLVGVTGQSGRKWIFRNADAGPAIVSLILDGEPESKIPVLQTLTIVSPLA